MGKTTGSCQTRDRRVLEALSLADEFPSISVDEAARHVHLSASRLRHLARSEAGLSITAEFRSLRLFRAAALLLHSGEAIKSIAHRAGYKHVTSFTRAFRAKFGISPADYRKHNDQDSSGNQPPH